MTPLMKHNFSEEVIIPLAALSYNLEVLSGREKSEYDGWRGSIIDFF